MKQFLVLLAVLPLMLVFFVQFSVDQINSMRAAQLTDIVYAAKEQAKQEGCFSADLQDRLRDDISSRLGISPDAVSIEADSTPVSRLYSADGFSSADWERGLIHYRVSVDIGPAMAGTALFGIKEKDNIDTYVIDSYTASERLR